jgi:predicted amidohydrolase
VPGNKEVAMKVAAVKWNHNKLAGLIRPEDLIGKIQTFLEQAHKLQIEAIVFPAFTGCFYSQLEYGCESIGELMAKSDSGSYIKLILNLSKKYQMAICPGSYWEKEGNCTYHTSCIIVCGQVLLKQRQVYLARWERELGLERGAEAELTDVNGFKAGIVLSTDVFYPQVSRMLALKGADIVFCPVGLVGKKSSVFQISGMWKEVQQNLFFAVESGFNGRLGDVTMWAESMIHAPLEMTDKDDGFLSRSGDRNELIYSQLDNEKRKRAISRFDVLAQLNPGFYRNMGMFRRKG